VVNTAHIDDAPRIAAVASGSQINPDPVHSTLPAIPANDPALIHSQPTPRTQLAYLRDVERLLDGRAIIGSRRTSYRYRAAWTWFLQKAMDGDISDELRTKLVGALNKCPPGSDQVAENIGRKSAFQGVPSRSRSKRPALSKLPVDWRERLINNADDSHLLIALSLLGLAGLRPSELERGVTVLWKEDLLAIGITGSKVRADRGQPWRILSLDAHHAWTHGLIDALDLEQGAAIGFHTSKARLQRQIRSLAMNCFPEVSLEYLPSSVSFRHQFSSDLKRDGVSRQLIAAALGHASERTSTVYGRKSQGRAGSNGLVNATASREIRTERGCCHIVSVTEASDEVSLADHVHRAALKPGSPSGPGGF